MNQEVKTLKFKSLKLGNKEVVSNQFTFNIDPDWQDNVYCTIQNKLCRMNYTGSWSGLLGDRGVKEGVQHYKVKIKKSLERHQLIGYISAQEKQQGKYWSEFASRNLLFSENGSTRSQGLTKFMKKQIKQGDILQCVCDIPNGLISWIVDDETKQVIAEAQIIPQFKGKEMIPYIGLEDVGDIVEILA